MPSVVKAAHAEESAEVEVLLANMDKLKTLTRKIQGSLNRLEASGRNVQDAIKPIYGNTSRLQVMNTNIDRVNAAIDKIRQPLDKSGAEDRIIRGGVAPVGLSEYVASIDRATQALKELENSNMRSNQQLINELNDLLKIGRKQLEGEFQQILADETQKVEPLYYITKDIPFPSINEGNSSKLRLIHSYISPLASQTDRETRAGSIWRLIRGGTMTGSLANLATATTTMAKRSNPETPYKQGTSGIDSFLLAFERMIAAEYTSICPIFPREQWMRVHTLTSQDPLKLLTNTLKDLHSQVKSNLITDCYLAYEIVDVVSGTAYRLESTNSELKQPILDAVRPVRETAKYSLQRLIEDTRNRANGIMTLSQDSAPVQVTNDTMTRLQTMTAYINPLGSILASVGEGGWRASDSGAATGTTGSIRSFDVGVNGPELFATYATDTLETLLSTLETKSRQLLKTKAAQGVFLANNVAIVDRSIASSELHTLIPDAAIPKLDAWRKRAVAMYMESWREPSIHLRDVQYTNRGSNPAGRPPSGDSSAFVRSMSNKEKEVTKEKFKAFNLVFDDLVAKHKSFKMEKEVRKMFAKEVTALIEPLYTRYYDRYHEIDKGKGKYVKYDKAQLSQVLASLA